MLDCRDEECPLDFKVRHKVLLGRNDLEEDAAKPDIVFLLIVADENIFQFLELCRHVAVILGEIGKLEVFIDFTLHQVAGIFKHDIILVVHVFSDFLHIVIEEADKEKGHLVGVGIIDGIDQIMPYLGERIIKEIGMRPLQIAHKRGEGYFLFIYMAAQSVADSEKGPGIDIIGGADFIDAFLSESISNVEAANRHQDLFVVANKFAHRVGRQVFLHLKKRIYIIRHAKLIIAGECGNTQKLLIYTQICLGNQKWSISIYFVILKNYLNFEYLQMAFYVLILHSETKTECTMKKTLLTLAIAIVSCAGSQAAETAIFMTMRDGTESTWLLSKKPVITFTGEDMKIAVGTETSVIKRADVATMTFKEDTNSLNPVTLDKDSKILYNGSEIMAAGRIEVYTLDGRLAAASEGRLATDALSNGIYVVSAANKSIKIVIK